LVLFVAAASRTGRAAEPTPAGIAAARALFSRAVRDEDAGRWADALEKLRRTGSVKMTPGIQFHIALCEERLGKLAAALTDYVAAEDAAREENNKDVLDAVGEPLAEVRARVPTITVWPPADVNDPEISLDGAPLASGSLGSPLPVDIGSHVVEGHAPYRAPFSVTVSSVERQALSVDVFLPSLASPPTATPAPAAAARDERSIAPRVTAIAASAGALAFVGFGVGAFFVAGAKQSSAEAQCQELVSCEGLKSPVRTWDALALTGWIAGAGAGALALYLWARPGAPPNRGAGAMLRVGPGSMQLVGRF
jgi:hypothetical protein